MSKQDTVSKKYFQDNERFADLFNFFLYGGENVISPNHLKDLDTTQIAVPFGSDQKSVPIQKYRDLLKVLEAKSDENYTYLLLAAELQTKQHYAMPVRNMLYDAIQYSNQVEKISKRHKERGDSTKDSDEFLSGFYKTDKLTPVITLVVYLGAEHWDAPRSLHEMLMLDNTELLKFIPDYKMNLITPEEISEQNFSKFHTELQQVMKFLKHSKDKDQLKKILYGDSLYQNISWDSAEMIETLTKFRIQVNNRKERVNMCKAIEDMLSDAKEEGMEQGEKQGRIKMLVELVKKGRLTIQQAAEEAEMTEEEFKVKMGVTA